MRTWLAALATAICAGCGSSDDTMTAVDAATADLTAPCDGSVLALTLDLARQKPGSNFKLTLGARRCDAVTGLTFDLKVTGGAATPLVDQGDGSYSSTVTPAGASGEVQISATAQGTTVTRTAVVLPTVADAWDQPEAIAGMVNTAGWEDSAQVSPDGDWLMVGIYSPIDLGCCVSDQCGAVPLDPAGAFCNTALGPFTAPLRPTFPGRTRIVDGTHITQNCLSIGIPPNGGTSSYAVPPVGGYLFHRGSDGSFADPSFVGFDADGCANASGYSFADTPNDTGSHLVFSFNDPRDAAMGNAHRHLYWTPIAFGADNSLATYQYSMGSGVTTQVFVPLELALDAAVPGDDGNPFYWNSRIWFDDEALAEHDLYFSDAMGKLQIATWSTPKVAGCSVAGKAESQPFLDDLGLYFTRDGSIVRADLLAEAKDPADPASWTAATVQLAPEAGKRAGAIGSIGHASIGRDVEGQWLYFNYTVQNGTGLDANVGRVRFR